MYMYPPPSLSLLSSGTTPMEQVTVPTSETCSITFWVSLLGKRRYD